MNCISAIGRMPMSAAPMDGAHDRRLADRRVDDARRSPNFSRKPGGDAEGAAVGADVLADHEDALVALHLLEHGEADGLEVGEDRPSARVLRARSHSATRGGTGGRPARSP